MNSSTSSPRGRSGELALDLYAGAGLFSTALACNFRHTVSVESSQTAASRSSIQSAREWKGGSGDRAEQYLTEKSRARPILGSSPIWSWWTRPEAVWEIP